MDNKTIQLLPDGRLIVTEPIPGGFKTISYFDSRLQLKISVAEKTADKSVLTKFMPDGRTVQSVLVETKTTSKTYRADGKTLEKEKEFFPNGSWQEVLYQPNGQTIRQMSLYQQNGMAHITLYQADGATIAQEIVQDECGLTKTSFYAANGKTLLRTIEDLSDGSTRTVLFNERTGAIVSVETGPLKGEAAPNIYQVEKYDSTGTKIISSAKIKK